VTKFSQGLRLDLANSLARHVKILTNLFQRAFVATRIQPKTHSDDLLFPGTQAKEAALRARVARGSLGRALASDSKRLSQQRSAMLEVLKALVVTGDRLRLLRSAEELNEARYKTAIKF